MAATTAKKQVEAKTIVDELREYRSSDILIKPYINPDEPVENMGLEKYGQVLFEGTKHEQQLRCTIINGVTRFVTGLDEFADSVKRLPEAERKAKVKIIRETVSQLEKEMHGNKLDVDDEDFWAKTVLSPHKPDYWATVNFSIGNDGKILDPNNSHELLLIIAAEAGGFDDVAGSYDEAKNSSRPPKFYLERRKDTKVQESKIKQLRDSAIYELFKIKTEEPQKLFWYCKNILPIGNQYKKTDPPDIWYSDLSSFIEGLGIQQDKKKAPHTFLNAVMKDMETLIVRAYVLEAAFLKRLITKADNKIYNRNTNSLLGGNLEEVVEYLKQPVNQNELEDIQAQIDPIWSR